MKPLAGIRVIELANFIAGPLAATLLADMGADVIKVAPPAGDMARASPPIRSGESVSFAALNRNKRSLVLRAGVTRVSPTARAASPIAAAE
jgi:CoA:oxalate CoA-transferase